MAWYPLLHRSPGNCIPRHVRVGFLRMSLGHKKPFHLLNKTKYYWGVPFLRGAIDALAAVLKG